MRRAKLLMDSFRLVCSCLYAAGAAQHFRPRGELVVPQTRSATDCLHADRQFLRRKCGGENRAGAGFLVGTDVVANPRRTRHAARPMTLTDRLAAALSRAVLSSRRNCGIGIS